MTTFGRWMVLLLAATVSASSAGCAFLHEFKPHRLKRWNHGVDGTSSDDYTLFDTAGASSGAALASISDPVAEREPRR